MPFPRHLFPFKTSLFPFNVSYENEFDSNEDESAGETLL